MMKNNSNTARKSSPPAAGVAKASEAPEATEVGFDSSDDDVSQAKVPGGVKKPGTP